MNWGTEINEKEARRKCEQWRSSFLPDIPYTTGPDASLLSPSVLPWWLYILDCWSRGNLFSLKLPPVRNLVTIVRETILSLGHTQLRWYHIKTGLLPVSPCFRAMLNLCGREGIWLFLPWLGQRTSLPLLSSVWAALQAERVLCPLSPLWLCYQCSQQWSCHLVSE